MKANGIKDFYLMWSFLKNIYNRENKEKVYKRKKKIIMSGQPLPHKTLCFPTPHLRQHLIIKQGFYFMFYICFSILLGNFAFAIIFVLVKKKEKENKKKTKWMKSSSAKTRRSEGRLGYSNPNPTLDCVASSPKFIRST